MIPTAPKSNSGEARPSIEDRIARRIEPATLAIGWAVRMIWRGLRAVIFLYFVTVAVRLVGYGMAIVLMDGVKLAQWLGWAAP